MAEMNESIIRHKEPEKEMTQEPNKPKAQKQPIISQIIQRIECPEGDERGLLEKSEFLTPGFDPSTGLWSLTKFKPVMGRGVRNTSKAAKRRRNQKYREWRKTYRNEKEMKRQKERAETNARKALNKANECGKKATLIAARAKETVKINRPGFTTEQNIEFRHNIAPEREQQRKLQSKAAFLTKQTHIYKERQKPENRGKVLAEIEGPINDKLKDCTYQLFRKN